MQTFMTEVRQSGQINFCNLLLDYTRFATTIRARVGVLDKSGQIKTKVGGIDQGWRHWCLNDGQSLMLPLQSE